MSGLVEPDTGQHSVRRVELLPSLYTNSCHASGNPTSLAGDNGRSKHGLIVPHKHKRRPPEREPPSVTTQCGSGYAVARFPVR